MVAPILIIMVIIATMVSLFPPIKVKGEQELEHEFKKETIENNSISNSTSLVHGWECRYCGAINEKGSRCAICGAPKKNVRMIR